MGLFPLSPPTVAFRVYIQATISGCDVIVSWNFKHMVRMATIQKVRTINARNGYFKLLDIVSPTVMLGDDADE